MADYILNSSWSDIDSVAAAHKSGAFIEKRNLYNPAERDILPVSAKFDGSLWARSAMVYSFGSMTEYDAFMDESTEILKNGDHVWIKSKGLNGASVYTLYLYFQNGLNKAVEIVSNASTGSGESDDTGKGAVIWYTNVGPNSYRFVISDLRGPAGAVPVPGHMIVSSYTGMGYFITATDGAAVTVSSYKVQVTGSKGDTGPQGPGAELFKVTFSHTSGGYAADKTNAEIYAAAESGKMVVGLDVLGRMMQLYRYGSTFAWFTSLGYDHDEETFTTQVYRLESDAVTADFGSLPDQSRLVQSVIAALPVYGGEAE